MISEEVQALLLSDTLVPDLFLAHYMPRLDALPLKIYLLTLLSRSQQKPFDVQDYCTRLFCTENELKTSLVRLSVEGLIQLEPDGLHFYLVDLKKKELQALLPRTQQEESASFEADESFERFMHDINGTFFNGMMSPTWYRTLEDIFSLYRFEPQVVYSLVKECYDGHKLHTQNYLRKVAEHWHKRGIRTFDDLTRDKEQRADTQKTVQFVARFLRRQLNEKEEETVVNWVNLFGFSQEIIREALEKSLNFVNPTFRTYNRILTEWHTNGLKTLDEVRSYEQSRRRRTARTSASASNVGNFSQREIPDDAEAEDLAYLQRLYGEDTNHE